MDVSKTMQKKSSEGTMNANLSPIRQAAAREEENVKNITSDETPGEDSGAKKVSLLGYTRRKSTGNQKLPNTKDLAKDDDGGDGCNRRLTIDTKNDEADVGCGSIRDNAPKREGRSQKGKKPVQVSDRVLWPKRAKQPKESEVIHNLQKQEQHTTRELSSRPETGNIHQEKLLESRNGQNEQEIPTRVWFKIDSLTVCLPTLEPDASSIYQASIRVGKEPRGGNAPDIGDEEKVHQTEPVTKPLGVVRSDVNTEGDQVQQAVSKDVGGGSDHYDSELTLGGALRSGISNKNGYMLAQDDRGMHMKQNLYPLTILDGKKRSSPESGEETRKKNRVWLFGHEISCEKEQAIWESGDKQPTAGDARVRYHIVQGSDHDQGVGNSSMQQPKSGLRLFGLNLQN